MADGFIESRMADHMSGRGGRRVSAPAGIRKGVAAALSALSLASVTTFAQGRVVEVESPAMRVYVPSKPTGLTVLALPGGGYSKVAADHEGYDWAPFFNSLGVTYAVLDYKLPEGDMRRPLGENAGELHVNPDSIGIMGFSAGGHLASAVATHPSEGCRPAFQILFYPVVTLTRGITHEGSAVQFLGKNDTPEMRALYSAEQQVTPSTPPAFIALSADDPAVSPLNSINYFLALRREGVDASMHIYPSGGHGWGFRRDQMPCHDAVVMELATWMKKCLRHD